MPRGQDIFIVVLQRVGLISKTILGSRRGFLTKFLPSSLRLGMIGSLTLSLKRDGVLIHQPQRQLMDGVARSIMVIFLREWIIVLILVNVGTKFMNSQMQKGKTRRVGKQVVLMMLRRRISLMFSPIRGLRDFSQRCDRYVESLYIDLYALLDPGTTL